MNNISSYSCRYMKPTADVHVIRSSTSSKGPVHIIRGGCYYTIPIKHHFTKDVNNAIVGFQCASQCHKACMDIEGMPCYPYSVNLQEMREFALTMKMPLIIVLNTFCTLEDRKEHHEIFYSGTENTYVTDLFTIEQNKCQDP